MSYKPLLNPSEAISIAYPGEECLPQHKVEDPGWASQVLSVFSPQGVTPTSKFVCMLPFPDGDARRHKDLSWFGQEKALRPAGGRVCIILHLSACTGANTSTVWSVEFYCV